MITFIELWNFIETTFVTDDVLHIINPYDRSKLTSCEYIIQTSWEKRFNIIKLNQLWEECYTFIIHNSCINSAVRSLIEEIEYDHNVSAQAHIYCGKVGSKSFHIHADNPDNIILQCIGKSKVIVYNEFGEVGGLYSEKNLSIKEELILEPGNSVYIPSKKLHLFEPLTDRLSISIPMHKNEYS